MRLAIRTGISITEWEAAGQAAIWTAFEELANSNEE